jgi:hypothetical protein
LIGNLPTALLSTNYFPNNRSLVKFSEKSLEIKMPKGHRSRKEILGIIITEVAKLDTNKIVQFNEVLNQVIRHEPKSEKSFFEEWEKAIKNMRFK